MHSTQQRTNVYTDITPKQISPSIQKGTLPFRPRSHSHMCKCFHSTDLITRRPRFVLHTATHQYADPYGRESCDHYDRIEGFMHKETFVQKINTKQASITEVDCDNDNNDVQKINRKPASHDVNLTRASSNLGPKSNRLGYTDEKNGSCDLCQCDRNRSMLVNNVSHHGNEEATNLNVSSVCKCASRRALGIGPEGYVSFCNVWSRNNGATPRSDFNGCITQLDGSTPSHNSKARYPFFQAVKSAPAQHFP